MTIKRKSSKPKGRAGNDRPRNNIAAVFQGHLEGRDKKGTRLRQALDRLYQDDVKTFLAYAYGKPVDTQMYEEPDGSEEIPDEVIKAARTIATRATEEAG